MRNQFIEILQRMDKKAIKSFIGLGIILFFLSFLIAYLNRDISQALPFTIATTLAAIAMTMIYLGVGIFRGTLRKADEREMAVMVRADAFAWRFMDVVLVIWLLYGLSSENNFNLIGDLGFANALYLTFPFIAYIIAKVINVFLMRGIGKK
ncbi:TPA: hypothetical protein DDW69_00115 [candidate division CPR2 bacterium]|uniref:Uncharacterized protein n=1 Tax=candidate division CPR2 bacterium GW2011_GWC1_41_48 TaxID=1618344 RepID=A0A0G0Z6T8_UNCC2|nr:MAG: hypothetical protein UT47_C0005G0044 [candidate division CPR2 bacterium GW2011_GWC2_39_35]KKR28472.1 MAG: hypothetical protein UT60_C0019G0007 [candidate division CPR2 bacterium GW2011_GWD2_39_7]KKR29462.1 MAG: hypothetical protein UT59_C0007G0016 [candidate division CPR2 bacterium GW2011_GWD1_39_7]KKS08733.1 MAG: hypothetical protein UU65_C0005G0044 [candidate division CPR2 bacterium GW2011_GWC1_41_48]OGB55620.1 MAG: hypothetical protein A2Y27_03235 [candidate division CPR2 bacterium G